MFLDSGTAKQSRHAEREPETGTTSEIIDDSKRLFAIGFEQIIVRYHGDSQSELQDQFVTFVSDTINAIRSA